MEQPIRFIAAAWSLLKYPAKRPWSVERQLEEIRKVGFDGVAARHDNKLLALAHKEGMVTVGGTDIGKKSEIRPKFSAFRDLGVLHINVQLCDHDTPTEKALPLAIEVIEQGHKMGLLPMIEFHRDTCTETPEKGYALATAYKKATGKLLPVNFDYSHPAIIKHLSWTDYYSRLVVRPDLLALSTLLHLRPFNGHHCQIPITDGHGHLSPEFKNWLPFCEKILQVWHHEKNWKTYRVIVPEQGPLPSGYALSCFPDVWKDTIVLKNEIQKIWSRIFKSPLNKQKSKEY